MKFDERGLVPVVAQEVDGTVLMVAREPGGPARDRQDRQGDVLVAQPAGDLGEGRYERPRPGGAVDGARLRRGTPSCTWSARRPACHTGTRSRFSETQEIPWQTSVSSPSSWATIESRKADLGQTESTRQLLSNPSKARRKVIEEAYEVNEAHQALDAGRDTKDHLAHEAADLLYHLYALLASADVTPAEVYSVPERRHGVPRRPKARGRKPLDRGEDV